MHFVHSSHFTPCSNCNKKFNSKVCTLIFYYNIVISATGAGIGIMTIIITIIINILQTYLNSYIDIYNTEKSYIGSCDIDLLVI